MRSSPIASRDSYGRKAGRFFLMCKPHVGKRWHKEIEKELHTARSIVVLWSAKSRDSDFVLEEAEYGKRKAILFPAVIEQVEYPHGFGRIQTMNLISWTGDHQNASWVQLLTALHEFLPASKTQSTPVEPA